MTNITINDLQIVASRMMATVVVSGLALVLSAILFI